MILPGFFITFEGGEGCGKSTQIALLGQYLAQANIPHSVTREPGGTEGAEQIRALLVNGDTNRWDAQTETLLFYAARLDHVNRNIKPALAQGKVVLCDRFADSTVIYQGVGKGLDKGFIDALHALTLDTFAPDLTIILDIDPSIGVTRALQRSDNETRFEHADNDFHQRIRQGFLQLAAREKERCIVVDAAQLKEVVHEAVKKIVEQRCALFSPPTHAGEAGWGILSASTKSSDSFPPPSPPASGRGEVS